ncbi:SH3 domain-binding protein 2-like isoform X2 [Mytilus trossulus]|uniref:SH3 domain-binding protein 2-like isoform X2 n=1 Tax=Mytilus trossulus TaxID=6551 RepID=UPI0030044599
MEEEEEDRVTEPRFTIGAQDISTLNTTNHHGFLRYEGGLEKFVRRTVIFKPFFREAVKWRQRFVVLCEGCMYLYKDEYATSPLKAFSLADFTRIQRFQDNDRRTRMKFQLVPLNEDSPQKFLTFCSSTDEERKVWFQKIRKEMDEAVHGSSHLQSDFDQDEYVSLETPVQVQPAHTYREPDKKLVKKSKNNEKKKKEKDNKPNEKDNKPNEKDKNENTATAGRRLPPSPPEDDDEDDLSDYDTIAEDAFVSRALPAVPPSVPKERTPRLIEPIKPKVPQKPQSNIKKLRYSRSEFEFNSSDRTQVEGILDEMSVGTFLVRKSRQDNQEVLSVKTDDGIKEYKIYNKNRGLSIDNKEQWFSTTEELLDHYSQQDIPNRVMTLSRAYSTTEDNNHL